MSKQQILGDEVDYIDSPAYQAWIEQYDREREDEAVRADEAEADFFNTTQRVEMGLATGRSMRTSGRFDLSGPCLSRKDPHKK